MCWFRSFFIISVALLFSLPVYAAPPVALPAPADIGDLNVDSMEGVDATKDRLGGSTIDPVQVGPSAIAKPENNISKEQRFVLKGVSVLGNETLKSEDVIAVVQPYVGKMVGQTELKSIVKAITSLYTSQGYVTSRCIIPKQEVKNGVIKLQLIEDKLRGIALEGERNYRYNTSLFAKHFHDLQGKIINMKELNSRLLILQRLPATHITPVLRKSSLNLTDLVLKITDAKDVTSFTVSNGASQFTGKQRLMLNSQFNNLSGNGDTLSLNASMALTTPKLFNSVSLSYVLPVGEKGGRVSFAASALSYNLDPAAIGFPTSDFIRYLGSSTASHIAYEQPFLMSKGDFWWGLGVDRQDVRAQTIYHQKFLTFNAGDVFVDSRDKLFVASATLRGNILDEMIDGYRGYTSVSLKVNHAVQGMLGSMTTEDINRKLINVANGVEPVTGPIGNVEGLDPRFWKFYVSASRLQAMPWGFALRLNASGEYTKSKKVPNSYDFIGADNGSSGFAFDASISRPIFAGLIGVVGYKSETAISYFRDLTPSCNGRATSRGINHCTAASPYAVLSFKNDDFSVTVQYVPHIDKYEQSQENLKASLSYLW